MTYFGPASTHVLILVATYFGHKQIDHLYESVHVLIKVTVDLRGVFWGKQYNALCINGKYINLYHWRAYITGYTSVLKYVWFN